MEQKMKDKDKKSNVLSDWGITQNKHYEDIEINKTKKVDVFKVMNSVFNKNYKPTDEEIEKVPEFLFHNLLTGNKDLIDIAVFFTINNIPIKNQFQFVSQLVPKMRIQYPKKTKVDDEDKLNNIQIYYNVSRNIAKQYLEMLPNEEYNRIKNILETNEGRI